MARTAGTVVLGLQARHGSWNGGARFAGVARAAGTVVRARGSATACATRGACGSPPTRLRQHEDEEPDAAAAEADGCEHLEVLYLFAHKQAHVRALIKSNTPAEKRIEESS